MRIRYHLLSTAAAALLLAAPAMAQQPNTANPPGGAPALSKKDMNFVKEAAIGGMAEVQLGKLAQQNAANYQVKQFGARMVQDHGAANNQLMQIARAQGINPPQQLDAKHQKLMDKLSQLHGAAFDRAYMRAMTTDHDKDVKEFRQEAQSSRDPQLKQFAEQTASVIEQHDQMAHQIDRSLTASGGSQRER